MRSGAATGTGRGSSNAVTALSAQMFGHKSFKNSNIKTQVFHSGDVLVALQDVHTILAPGKGLQGEMVGQERFKCLMGVVFTAGR